MTSTNTFKGMELEKPTSKVLAPPGGRASINFGGWDDPAPVERRPVSVCQAERMRSSIFDDEEPPKRAQVPIVPVQPQQAVNACQAARMKSSVFSSYTEEKPSAPTVPVTQTAPEQSPVVEETKPVPEPVPPAPEPTVPVQPPAPVQPPPSEPVVPEPTPAPAPVPQRQASNPVTSPIHSDDRPIGVGVPQPRSVRIIKPPGGGSSITFG